MLRLPKCLNLVVRKIERDKVVERKQALWDRSECIFGESESCEGRELEKGGWKSGKSVAVKFETLETAEVGKVMGKRFELVIAELQSVDLFTHVPRLSIILRDLQEPGWWIVRKERK